jgi:DNA-binding MarR family transcriptional regulator
MNILIRLKEDGRLSGRHLCEALGMSPSALSQQLDTLDHGGYLSRDRDTQDRRVTYFGLTAEGAAKADELDAKRREFFAHVTGTLSNDEMATLLDLHQRLLEHLEKHANKK